MFPLYSWLRLLIHEIQANRIALPTLPILLCTAFHVSADAYTVDYVSVFEREGVYHINITAEIAAPANHVRHVLTDYVHIYRLSDSIIESKVFPSSADEKTQVETLVLCCVPIFCREVTRVEEVSVLASGNIRTRIIPEKSDFLSGNALWEITPIGERTRLTYQASIEPDFFIPPILGTQMVINNMQKEFKATYSRIEHIARINEAREWDNDFAFVNIEQRAEDGPCMNEIITSLQ